MTPRIDIDVAQEKAEIAPTMCGDILRSINRSADGGIYARRFQPRLRGG